MSNYIFIEGSPASTFKPVFERFLFNEERHRHSQSKNGWITFSLINEQAEQVVAQIHFSISNSIASSPAKAPFGSFEFLDSLSPETLFSFFEEIQQKLKAKGVQKITIRDTAHQYRLQQSTLLTVLFLNAGFQIKSAEINSSIKIDNEIFENKISHAELKRLKRCRQEGLEFRFLPLDLLDETYAFVEACRSERGMLLSMSLSQLKNTVQSCSEDFLLFGVFQEDELVAASISVKVNDRILYDFYHAHTKSADHLSPVVFLVEGMYSFCRENKFKLLDLGTSAVDSKINFSLLNFKTQIGGDSSMKLTFEKDMT